MKTYKKISAAFCLLLSFMIMMPMTANALGSLTIVVKNSNPNNENPNWFNYEKKPGTTIHDTAIVKNVGDQPATAHVYAVDGTTNNTGSFILKLENEARTGIGKWTKVLTPDTVIQPGKELEFPFQMTVPADLPPGQYFGGLIVEETPTKINGTDSSTSTNNPASKICCTNILVKTRIGLRIYLTVPGEIISKMEWTNFSSKQRGDNVNFSFLIKNTGNVALIPRASIQVYDTTGNQVDSFEKILGESLPGKTITPSFTWDKHPIVGKFSAQAQVLYDIKNPAATIPLHGSNTGIVQKLDFWIIPWKILTLILVLIIIMVMTLAYQKMNRRDIRLNWEPYEVKANENIRSIAESHEVQWKHLAHINKLKAPFILNKGDTIRVPKKKESGKQPPLFDEKKHE